MLKMMHAACVSAGALLILVHENAVLLMYHLAFVASVLIAPVAVGFEVLVGSSVGMGLD